MKRSLHLLLFFLLLNSISQQLKSQPNANGQLDAIEDLSTIVTVPLQMPDGVHLMTDVFLPVTSDSVLVEVDLGFGTSTLEVIPKGIQLIVYDTLYGEPNPNPYLLPLIFTRSPYNKNGDIVGRIVSLLGYNYALQDMRGRYTSEGVYFPMLSDSWDKSPYHPESAHHLDLTELDDPHNSNRHEDGYNSIQQLLELEREYDLDGDGIKETTDKLFNGNIGMFGASALGNTQYQAAGAHKIDPDEPGLKSLLPIVATNDHFTSTGYNNGVFRESLVSGWVRGQLYDLNDDLVDVDEDLQNAVHTAKDYGLENKFQVAEGCIDHFSSVRYNGGVASAYPNSLMRSEMDASSSPVNEFGDGDANGQFNRYSNMEVPQYHLAGWWDIFVNGQINTYNRLMENLSDDYDHKSLQKLVIGPWAHQTTGGSKTGDITYPDNSSSVIGADFNNLDLDNIDLSQLINSEVLSWYRYTLNERFGLGEPKIVLPESDKWQEVIGLGVGRIPAEEYKITLATLLNFLSGAGELPPIPAEIAFATGDTLSLTVPLPDIDLSGLGFLGDPVSAIPEVEFKEVPNVRFYVVGPVEDGVAENENTGNYWYGTDHFPLTEEDGIIKTPLYLHSNGSADFSPHETDEGFLAYTHDPDNPVRTVGGANMIVQTPPDSTGDTDDSQGQIDLANPDYIATTMENQGVIQFETEVIEDSLNVMGFAKAKIYASSNPEGAMNGPTDTDFFIRILDVYPDGRELFVVEGAVNARARDYVRTLIDDQEDVNVPFTNIEIGAVYEYEFELLPIAYTWAKGHKMKVLISSSNYTRYQVNPNLPIEDGDFFRREPGDGKTYVFDGEEMSARIAEQNVFFSMDYPSQIELPVYQQNFVGVEDLTSVDESKLELTVFPNPAQNQVYLFPNLKGEFNLKLINSLGQIVLEKKFNDQTQLDVSAFSQGLYLIELEGQEQVIDSRLVIR